MEPADNQPQSGQVNPGGQSPGEDAEPIISIDFRRYFAAIRKYLWLVGALVAFAIACAVVFTTRTTPIYEAIASVQIEPRLPDLLGTGDMFNLASSGANSAEYYKQQRRVLSSYTLCKQTVEQFDLYDKLLDMAVSKDERYDPADDPRRLRPGEIEIGRAHV